VRLVAGREFLFADAMRFIPVSDSFHLSPLASSVHAPQPRELADSSAYCDGLDIGDVADTFEIHPR